MNEEANSLGGEEEAKVLPWITGIEAFQRYNKNLIELKALTASKKIRMKRINGTMMYSTEDLEKLPSSDDGSIQETSMADLVRAARDMLAVSQKHDEVMFDKYMSAFDKLLKTASDSIEKQNDHIMKLEQQGLAMREAAEKVFNLEHERKMGELREERTRNMQTKALEMLQKTFAPWVAQKLGGQIPGLAPEGMAAGEGASVNDPRLASLGQAVVGMVIAMSEEKFQALSDLIPAEEFGVLSMIREGMKG